MTEKQFDVTWVDGRAWPKHPPNPDYPRGIDLDLSRGKPSCMTELPYPAARIGRYVIYCKKCKTLSAVTTAGRPDDPRSVRVECPLKRQ